LNFELTLDCFGFRVSEPKNQVRDYSVVVGPNLFDKSLLVENSLRGNIAGYSAC